MALKAVLLLVCTAGALAGPLNYQYSRDQSSTECARTCPDTGKFDYVPGNTYEYQYVADIKTHIPGTTEEHSSLHLRANVQIEAIAKCEMALRMSGVTLQDSDPREYLRRQPLDGANEWARSLQERPLRFAFLDGTVDAICPEENEDTWILNVKRGILSSLQNTMVTLDGEARRRESDVSGECDVEYKIAGQTWSTKIITKSKDMLSCSGHQHLHSIIRSTPYRVSSKLQSLPLLKSTQECTQEVNRNNLLSSSICKETHIFRPFSRGASGASTEVEQKLTFSRQSRGTNTRQDTISSRKELIFEHVESVEELESSRRSAQNTLRELCRETSQDIRPTTPALFSRLVQHLKKLNADTLMTIHRGSSGICAKAHEFVHDALPTLGTTSAVRVMKNLVLSGEADEMEADIWFTSMSFISDPNREILSEVKPVLTSDRANRKATLAISALVHSYCRVHTDCGEHQEVRDIISIFEDNLRYNCKTTTDDLHDKVIMSLKAIGNTGHAESVAPTLTRCFENEENPMYVRIAAVNAFRRMACYGTSELLELLRNTAVDSELRINAYLSLMECPTETVLLDIRHILEDEEVNQVGSFIWTHLTNLMETSSPLKQETRIILEQVSLEKKFNLDQRKFSRNIELSGFSTMLNAGAAVESNLIWSSKSWIPRSASLDLTIDMFGQSVNLIEMGGRVEGADGVVERMFANKDVNDVLSRQKRDVIRPDTFDSFGDFKPGYKDYPEISYFVRIFGNEIRYDDFSGFDGDTLKEKFNYLQWLIELAKDHEIDATKSIQFLDSSLVVPTVVGLPLKLSVDGNAVMDIKVRGKLDIRNIGAAPRSLDIDGSIRPSAAVEISGEMGVDAWIAKTGLKMVNTLHTSNVAEGRIQLQDGQVFNMDINMPGDRVELFDFRSQFYIVHRDSNRQQQMISEDRTEKDYCIAGKLQDALGVKLCGEIAFPTLRPKDGQPWFPFNGPVTAMMFVQKGDTHTGYHMEAKLVSARRTQDNDELKVSFNTPGSQVDRELTLDYMLNRQSTELTLGVKSPWKKADFTGTFTNEADKKKVTARVMLDDRKEYSFTSEVAIQKSKLNTRYTPLVELSIPEKHPYRLTGNVLYRPGKKIDVDLSVVNVFSDVVTVTGDVTYIKKRSRWQSNLALNSPKLTASVDGYVEKGAKGDLVSSRFEVEYTLDPRQKNAKLERFTVSNKWRYMSRANSQYSLDTAVTSTKWPEWNMDGNFELANTQNNWESSIDAGLTDTNKRIKWTQSLINNSNRDKVDFDLTARFRFPFKKLDYQLAIDHQHTMQMVKHSTTVRYAAKKETILNIDAEIESRSPLKARIDSALTYPGRNWAFSERLEEKQPKEYHHMMDIKLDAYDDVKVKSILKMQPRHELMAEISIPHLRPIKLEGFLNPDLKNFQGHAETSYGTDTYALDTSWFFNGRPIAFSSRGGVEVAYPGRRIKTEGEFSRRQSNVNGRFDVKWDVDGDQNKKVSVTGELDLDSSQPNFQIKTQWYPNRFIDLSGTFKNDKKGWFAVTRDLEGKLEAVTSFRGYENMYFMFRHDQARDECKTHSELSWGRGQKIEYSFDLKKPNDWNDLQVIWSIKTPFEEYRTGTWELSYNFQPGQLRAGTKFDYNGQVVSVNFNGRTDFANHVVDGTITVTTPFRGFEDMVVSLKHSDNGQVFNSELKGRINPRVHVELTFSMNHQMKGWAITNNGELSFTCPKGEKKLTWDHKNDRDNFNSNHELDWMGRKSTINIEASHKKTYKKRNIDLKARFTRPYADDILINFDHQHDRKNYKNIRTSGNFQWQDNKNIAFENDMNYVPNKYTTKNLKITTPFEGYEEISSTVNTRINGDEITSHREINWGNSNRITSDETLKIMDGYQFEYSWRMSTPFKKVQRVMAKISNINQNGVWETDIQGQLNRDKAQISTEVGYPKKLKIDVRTPYKYIRTVLADLEYQGNPRDFSAKATLNHNMLDEAIVANLKVDTKELDDIKGVLSLKTPFRDVKDVRSTLSHKLQHNTYKTDASLQVPRYKGTVSNAFMFNAWNNWSTKTELEYLPGKKIKVNTELAMNRQGAAGEFSFESPFPGAEMYKLTFKHEGDLSNMKQNFNIEVNGESISGTNEFIYNGRDLECITTLRTPYHGWQNNELRIKHEGEPTDFRNDISFRYDEKIISTLTEYEYDNTGAKGKFELNSPWPFLRDFKLELYHSGSMGDFRNSGSVQYNGRRYSGNTQYKNNRRGYSAVAAVSIPEEYGFSLNHEGDYYDMNNNMELNFDGKKIRAETIYKNDGRNLESSFNVKSPYRGYENTKVSMNYRNTGSGFVTSGDLESSVPGYKKLNFEISHDGDERGFKTSGTIKTPFEVIPTANFEVSHTGGMNDFSSSGAVEVNSRRYSGNVNYENDRSGIEAAVAVQTPHEYYENQGFSVAQKNSQEGFRTAVRIDTSYPGYKNFGTEIVFKSGMQHFLSSFLADTPLRMMPSRTMSISHSGESNDFDMTFKAVYNGKEVGGTVTRRRSGGWWETDHKASIALSFPYDQLRSFEIKTEHKDQGRQCTGSIEVTINGEMKVDADYTRRTGNRKSIEVNVRSPRPMTASVTMDASGEINGEASINWNPRSRNKNIRFEYGLKNQVGDRRLKFKTILPNRIVGIDTGYTTADDRFAHDLDFQWDRDDTSKITYNTEASVSRRRRQSMFDWKLDVTSPYGPLQMSLSNSQTPNRCVTELGIKGTEKLTVKNDVVMRQANFQDFSITTTVMHPRMNRDAILKIEGVMQPQPFKYDGSINFQYAIQNFAFTGKIADESAGLNSKYVAEAKATHPNSFLDFDFKSEVGNSRQSVGGNMQVKYQTASDREVKTLVLRAEINKLRDELNLEMQTPLNKDIRLTGRQLIRDFENGIHKFSLSGNVASSDISGELEVDTSSPGAEMKINYSPEDMVHIYGRYLTPSHMQMEVNHENRGQKTQDAHVSLQLDTDGMLGTRAFLRKEIQDDIKKLFDSNDAMGRQLGEMKNAISEEFNLKMKYLGRAVVPFQNAWEYTMDTVNGRLEPMSNDFRQAYGMNEFYIRDICEAGQSVINEISDKVSTQMSRLRQRYDRQWEQLKRDWSQKYEQWYQQMGYDIQEAWQRFNEWKDTAVRDATENVYVMIDRIRMGYTESKQSLYRAAQGISPQGLIEKYENFIGYLQTQYRRFRNTEFAKSVMKSMNSCYERLQQSYEDFKANNQWLVEEYWEWYYKWNDVYRQVMSYPEAQQMKAIVSEVLQTSNYWFDYMEFEKKANQIYITLKNTNWETLTEQAKMYLQNKLQWERNRIIVWDPDRIEFQAEMFIPVEIRDLQSLPRPNIQRYVTRARNWVNHYIPEDDYTFYDSLYKYKPSADYYNWVPPFKTHATISGSQHYMTFDKNFYEFSGECSYLLARDFIDGNFTVIANYDSVGGTMTKKSLTVMVDNKEVEIFPNFKVLVDGRRSETPVEFGSTVVHRTGNKIRVDSKHGITITCDLPHDRCTVNITGWYYGKTGGLFGTYDNEPSTEFMKSDNMIATSPEELASSWSVGRRCSVRNHAVQGPETADHMRICGKYFRENTSPFRICFKQVDSEAFMKMCLNDLPTNVNQVATEEDACNVASFYVDECERAGVPLRMPTSCVKCMTEDGRTYREGDNMTLSNRDVPKSADVVFVASQRSCNRDIMESLSKVVTRVDKALKAKGLNGNRFSLVGYAADGWFNMPHTHTMQNEIFNDQLKFSQALQNFHIVDSSDMEDPLTALEFAAKLPFRTGVSKSILLIPCGDCKEMSTSYLDIQQLLLNRDIHLHVLQQQDFKLKKNTPTSSYIFGVDKDGVYTQKHVGDSELVGDRDLRQQVSMPKDLCVALTQESDGSVFNALKLNGRPVAQKKFVDVMTRLVAKKATPAECQKCDCMGDSTGQGIPVCRNCQARNVFYDFFPSFENSDYFESDGESSEENTVLNEKRKQYKPKKSKKITKKRRELGEAIFDR